MSQKAWMLGLEVALRGLDYALSQAEAQGASEEARAYAQARLDTINGNIRARLEQRAREREEDDT